MHHAGQSALPPHIGLPTKYQPPSSFPTTASCFGNSDRNSCTRNNTERDLARQAAVVLLSSDNATPAQFHCTAPLFLQNRHRRSSFAPIVLAAATANVGRGECCCGGGGEGEGNSREGAAAAASKVYPCIISLPFRLFRSSFARSLRGPSRPPYWLLCKRRPRGKRWNEGKEAAFYDL